MLAPVAKLYETTFLGEKIDFYGLISTFKNILQNSTKYLDFTSLMNNFAAVEAQKYLFQIFNNNLSNTIRAKNTCFNRSTSFTFMLVSRYTN